MRVERPRIACPNDASQPRKVEEFCDERALCSGEHTPGGRLCRREAVLPLAREISRYTPLTLENVSEALGHQERLVQERVDDQHDAYVTAADGRLDAR
jgi:hypothetical protein